MSWQWEVCPAAWFTWWFGVATCFTFGQRWSQLGTCPTQSSALWLWGVMGTLGSHDAQSAAPTLHTSTWTWQSCLSPGWAKRDLIRAPKPALLLWHYFCCKTLFIAWLMYYQGSLDKAQIWPMFPKNVAWHPQKMTTGWINKKDMTRWFLTPEVL